MKKFTVLMLVLAVCGFVFAGCNDDKKSGIPQGSLGGGVLEIYVPDGAPALALVSIFDRTEIGGQKVKFTVVPSENIGPALLKETPDLALAPTNAIATVYNKGKDYNYISAHTHGNLYIVGTQALSDLSELKGKTLGVFQQGNVPDFIIRTLLSRQGVNFTTDGSTASDKVTLRYFQSGADVINGLKSGTFQFGLLAEPAVTNALAIDGMTEVFDLQTLWGGDGYPQAGLAARGSISDGFISAFFDALEEAGNFAETHPSEAIERIASHMSEGTESTISKLSSETVRRCNIKLERAEDCKDDVMALLQAFFDIDNASLGGKMPDENFFRIVKE